MLGSYKYYKQLPTRTKLLVVLGVLNVCYLAALFIEGNLSSTLLKRKPEATSRGDRVQRQEQLPAQSTQTWDLQGDEKRRGFTVGPRRRAWMTEPLLPADFVVAVPGHRESGLLFAAGRASRQGLRTFLATSYESTPDTPYSPTCNETWAHYPDDNPLRSWYPGDTRAAILPFLAYKQMRRGPAFKWLFYGDDDTVFFLKGAMETVKALDPGLPYFLTDNIWYSTAWDATHHPHPLAPRCLPCSRTVKGRMRRTGAMPTGCPCTPKLLCKAAGQARWDVKGCKDSSQPYSMHGGAGALISLALLERLAFEEMEACILRQHDSGGDAFLTTCLWEHGIGLTSPTPLEGGSAAFDPSPPPLHPDDYTLPKAAHVLGSMLLEAAGLCHTLCQAELSHTVSTHLRARRTGGSQQGTAAFVRLFSRFASVLDGRSSWGSHSAVNDTLDATSAAVANAADVVLQAAMRTAKVLAERMQAALDQADAEELNVRARSGVTLSAKQAIMSAAALTVAEGVMRDVLGLVRPAAEWGFEDESCNAQVGPNKEQTSWRHRWIWG